MREQRFHDLFAALEESERERIVRAWGGGAEGQDLDAEAILARMQDEEGVAEIQSYFDGLTQVLLDYLLDQPGFGAGHRELVRVGEDQGTPTSSAELAIKRLVAQGFVFETVSSGVADRGEVAWVLPRELAEVLRTLRGRALPSREPQGPLTLKDYLQKKHFHEGQEEKALQHARQAYKLFLMPNAVLARIRRLDPKVRELVELALKRYGGILPKSLAEKTPGGEGAFADSAALRRVLEESLLGTVRHFDFRRYGMEFHEEALWIFQEVTLVYLKNSSRRKGAEPEKVVAAGVDIATNVMRFLRYVDENGVRFTVKGEIFKATEKRIMARLVTDEAGEEPQRIFRFLYRFCRQKRLIEPTGERTFRLSEAGRNFEEMELIQKLRLLLAFAIEDGSSGGDPFHQVRLRRILLRLLRRLEPGHWYEAMFLPHLARNSYMTQLDGLGVEAYFDDLREQGCFLVLEDQSQLIWNLFHWVRHRLHMLGIVDFGYSGESSIPQSLRLSRLGAALLSNAPGEGGRSTLVVNPDFEILLFPEEDAFELVHSLDRFSTRTSAEHVYRFQITEESVRSALADGMGIAEILDVLTDRCRVQLPQNVLFSLQDWGDRAGLLVLSGERRLRARKPEMIDKLLEHPRVRELTGERPSPNELEIQKNVRLGDFRGMLRDLGFYLVLPAKAKKGPEKSSPSQKTG
ncbi:MAG TPA: hypothetical protein ENK02_04605 [Planctomycetes bacterium]|nr:hypothetical protein [Planctomycetota bacterium]